MNNARLGIATLGFLNRLTGSIDRREKLKQLGILARRQNLGDSGLESTHLAGYVSHVDNANLENRVLTNIVFTK